MVQSRINRGRARREELREEAEMRASDRASRSNAEQIATLDARLGLGVGSVRERARLTQSEVVDDKSKSKQTRRNKSKSKAKSKAGRREVDKERDR